MAAYRRASAGAPDDARWAIAAATALPVIPASREAIAAARARLEAISTRCGGRTARCRSRQGDIGPNFYLSLSRPGRPRSPAEDGRGVPAHEPLAGLDRPALRRAIAPGRPAPPGRLRLALPPGALHRRATRGLVEQLSRDRFEVIVFHAGGTIDATSAAIDRSADRAIRLPGRLGAARQRIAAETLDVLFYPDIGMESMTYLLAFARLAPVQCVTWGHPVTTGIPTMDYFLSSAALEPDGSEAHYTERLHRLSRLPAYFYPPVAPAGTLTSAALGIEAGARLYLCAQSLFKLHPDYDAILGEILRRDPGDSSSSSRACRASWSRDWRERFTRACPDVSERVRVLPRLPTAEFLDLLWMADALLDPLPFGGGTTSYAALGLGAPIVTWPGPFMRGRVTYGCYQPARRDGLRGGEPRGVRGAGRPPGQRPGVAGRDSARASRRRGHACSRISAWFARSRTSSCGRGRRRPGRIWPDQAGIRPTGSLQERALPARAHVPPAGRALRNARYSGAL